MELYREFPVTYTNIVYLDYKEVYETVELELIGTTEFNIMNITMSLNPK